MRPIVALFGVAGLLALVAVVRFLAGRAESDQHETPPPPPGVVEPAPPPAATAAPSTAAAPRPAPAAPTEAASMDRARALAKTSPREALAILDALDRAHPASGFAEERLSLRIDALVGTGEVGVARDHAEEYLRRYPDGAFAAHVEQLTGVHPRPPPP